MFATRRIYIYYILTVLEQSGTQKCVGFDDDITFVYKTSNVMLYM